VKDRSDEYTGSDGESKCVRRGVPQTADVPRGAPQQEDEKGGKRKTRREVGSSRVPR